ncbi:MAG: hypothetical protein QM533_10185 [Cytophagales bacterium]|nr:hypothetical protein [Cytophagales bacterium]
MSQSQRVELILNQFYKKRIREKKLSLVSLLKAYADSKDGLDGFISSLDIIAVDQLCKSYYIDVVKYKEYHLSPENSNPSSKLEPFSDEWTRALHNEKSGKRLRLSKVAAFTAKWILKYKPINLEVEDNISPGSIDPKKRRLAASLNEDFALAHTFQLMNLDTSKIPDTVLADMIYHYRYRSFDERHFFIMLDHFYENYI